MSEAWFKVAFGAHYPALYAHRNRAEAKQCFDLLPRLAPLSVNNKPVLDLGCGDGRHLEFLVDAGVACVGLDLSDSLLKIASARALCPALVQGDMRIPAFIDSSFDSVLSLFTAFGYFGSLTDNSAVVEEISRILTPGGHWFFDYFNCDKVVEELGNEQPFVRERTESGMNITETRRYSSRQAVVNKDVELLPLPSDHKKCVQHSLPPEGLRYTEQVAVFTLQEMDALASSHGLQRVNSAGGYNGVPLGEGPRWILVYQKQRPDK